MNTKDEALKLALEALKIARDQIVDPEYAPIGWSVCRLDEVLENGQQALAAPVQEPVAWLFKDDWGRTKIAFSKETANEWGTEVQPLYTTPPVAQPAPVQESVAWTPGSNLFKDWCSQYFGPDADDAYIADAIFNLPPMAQRFAVTPPAAQPAPVQGPKFWYDEEMGELYSPGDDRPDGCTPLFAAQPAPDQSCYCENCEAMGKELAALKAQPAPDKDKNHDH